MEKMTLLSLLLVSVPEAVLVAALGFLLVGIRINLSSLLVIGLLQGGVAYLVRLSPVFFGLHSILEAGLFLLILRLVTRLPFKVVTLAGLLGLLVYMSIEMISAPFFLSLARYSLTEVLQSGHLRIFFFLPEALFMVLFIVLCLRFNLHLVKMPRFNPEEKENNPDKRYYIVYLANLLPLFLLGTMNFTFYIHRANAYGGKSLDYLFPITGASVIVLSALSFAAVRRTASAVAAEYETRQTKEIVNQTEQLLSSLRNQRHDFNHHLQTIYGLLETGSFDEAREYLQKQFQIISTTDALIRTDHLYLSALLYTKIALARAKQIRIETSIGGCLKELPLNNEEISSLFGNLLDNAFEAAENLPPEEREVRVEITRARGYFTISVANRGPAIDRGLHEKIFRPRFSTKKNHPGMGLAIVREIIEKHGGSIELSSDSLETVFRVRIPDKNG